MASTTTYTCDRCGAQAIDETKFLKKVRITLPDEYSAYQSHDEVASAFWCRSCIVECGLRLPKKDEQVPVTKPTLEEIIRDIVREELQPGSN